MSGKVWMISEFKLPLKRCPFCGFPPRLYEAEDKEMEAKLFKVKCSNFIFCEMKPQTPMCGNPVLAAEKWNRRKEHE